VLAARYELFDIPDVEALCVRSARNWAPNHEASDRELEAPWDTALVRALAYRLNGERGQRATS
jgi:hypothetical protein